MTELAIRFQPEAQGDVVPLDVFASTLHEIEEGLNSLRLVLAPILAERVKWATADVREYLRPGVLPPGKGSLVVPITMGAGSAGLIGAERVADTFWRYAGQVLKGTAAQRSGMAEIPGACAGHFARAAKRAREDGRSRVQMVARRPHPERRSPRSKSSDWRSVADLTGLEGGLARYADRRNQEREVSTHLIGRVIGLQWDPPEIEISLSSGQKRAMSISASRRAEVRNLWGTDVVVDVQTKMTLDGEIRGTPKVLNLKPTVRVDDLGKDFDSSVGAGRGTWDTQEAEDYIKGLRGRES